MPEEKIPRHVAIIMDGNGRWAKNRNLPRFQGHLEGVKRVEEITQVAESLGVKVLTLYTFSTENWDRPKNEVSMLLKTMRNALDKKTDELARSNVRLRFIGCREGVPETMVEGFERAMEKTNDCDGMTLIIAFNYGARQEILGAVRQICQDVGEGRLHLDDLNEEMFGGYLYTRGIPDPDLLIRTSGEQRISNFLLWQLSYAEFYFTPKCWPDFNRDEFMKAVYEYQKRERRYGKIAQKKTR